MQQNLIKHNTAKSKELLEALKTDSSVVGLIPQKELFNRATKDETVIDMMLDSTLKREHKNFFSALTDTLNELQELTDMA